MTAFSYRDERLHAEDVPLDRIAAEVGTPFYCYALGAIERSYRAYVEAFAGLDATLCYALKANSNLAVVRALARLGAGADVVSEGELRVALAAGVPPERIVFAGVGKTAAEMAFALDCGIAQFNVESLPELRLLDEVARARGVAAPIALRINPDVDAQTHEKISTGKSENKFGIDLGRAPEAAALARDLPGIALQGLAVHIGSQLTDLAPFRAAFARLVTLYVELRAEGLPLGHLDLGGGLGIAYRDEVPPALGAYAETVRELCDGLEARLVLEPGRALVGNAGVLVTRVIYVKEGVARRFLVVDSAMNDLIRPSLYDAWHELLPLAKPAIGAAYEPADIVGPICETGDTLARQRPMPPMAADDLLAISSSGAYGAVMASSYNSRLLPPEVVVRGGDWAVSRPRQGYDELIGRDSVPDWLETGEPGAADAPGPALGRAAGS